jgi:hypothetical protein
MPEISRFFGIVIKMFFDDHPVPHIHAEYGGDKAKFAIRSGEIIKGKLSPRAERLVREWIGLHQAELLENWQRSEKMQAPRKIQPLD